MGANQANHYRFSTHNLPLTGAGHAPVLTTGAGTERSEHRALQVTKSVETTSSSVQS